MELKRVVVTGLGALTPVGNTVAETWENIKNLIKLIHEQVLNNYNIDLILEQEIITWE